MMRLDDSLEWRLLQALGRGVTGRLSRYARASGTVPTRSVPVDKNLAFLEVDLREVLRFPPPYRDLSQSIYDELQDKLRRLCNVLEPSVNLELIKDPKKHTAEPYPNLQALVGYLNDLSPDTDSFTLDLVNGPNVVLFLIEAGSQAAKDAHTSADDCCLCLLGLLTDDIHNSAQPTTRTVQSAPSPDVRYVQQTKEVLDAMFERFNCEPTHEILVQLSDEKARTQSPPSLDLLLSLCSRPDGWQQVWCIPHNAYSYPTVERIDSICRRLQAQTGGTTLQIIAKRGELFEGSYGVLPPPSYLEQDSVKSLETLLADGAFLQNNSAEQRPRDFFSPDQKCALALKLTYCLMDFIDSGSTSPNWDSDKVRLVTPRGAKTQDGLLYVGFRSREVPLSDNKIKFGDLIILNFAKLLLEIEGGESIRSEPDVNLQFGVLSKKVSKVHQYSKLYANAVLACLNLHIHIRNYQDDGNSNHAALRNAIYGEVITHLQTALKGGKRRRSDSQPATHNSPCNPSKRRRVVSLGKRTVFRIRAVTLQPQRSITDTIRDIIWPRDGGADVGKSDFKSVLDITPWAVRNSESRSGKLGAALVTFHDGIPESVEGAIHYGDGHISRDDAGLELSMDIDTTFIGATQLFEPPPEGRIIADIVAIHGLNGHPYGSWRTKSNNPQMWLHNFLPKDVNDCRIFIYGYRSNIFDEEENLQHDLYAQASRLNSTLKNLRNTPGSEKRPIIFFAHSYGGLVLAQALIEAKTRNLPVHKNTIGLFLFACPRRGFYVKDIQDAMRAEHEASGEDPTTFNKAEELVQRLGQGDFHGQLASFPDVVKGKKVYTFAEVQPTPTITNKTGQLRRNGEPVLAANPNSVILGLPYNVEEVIHTEKDHSNIVKFASRSDQTYEDVKCRLDSLLEGYRKRAAGELIPRLNN